MYLHIPDDPAVLIVYGLIIISGLIDCFFGYRVFRLVLAVLLGLIGAGWGAYLGNHFGSDSWTAILVGLLIGGILGVVLSMFFFRASVAVSGAMFGYAMISPWVASFAPWIQLLILIAGCGLCGLISIFAVNFAIMLATAFSGAFRVVYGGWYLVGGPAILVLRSDAEAGWHILGAQLEPFVAMVVLGAVGFFFQWSAYRREQKKE